MNRILAVVVPLILLSFIYSMFNKCFIGFFNSELENKIMCSMVASEMGDYNAQQNALRKTEQYIQENRIHLDSLSLMGIRERISNDVLELYKLNSHGKDKKIEEVYNARVCQKLYND